MTLKFDNLQDLADCLYHLGLNKPSINYEDYTITASLTDKQLEIAKQCRCVIIEGKDDKIVLE